MLSRRNIWLLIALPIALILLWAAQQVGAPSDEGADELPPPLGRGLVYLSPASGLAQLFHIDLDSGEIQQLSEAEAVSSFDISADGGSLVYSAANATGGSDLWTLDLSTRQSQVLLDCAAQDCSHAAFSADGERVAYQVDFTQIWLLTLANGEGEQVSPDGELSRDPQWSLDGRLSYYVVPSERYEVYRSDEGGLPGNTNVDTFANQTGERLSWAADGESFVAAEQVLRSSAALPEATPSASTQTPTSETALPSETITATLESPAPTLTPTAVPVERLVSSLMQYGPNDSGPLFDVGDNLVEDTSPAFSPDGKWLAFTRKYLDEARWTPGRQLWLYELESGLALAFSDSPNFHISAPSWSADSQQIAFLRGNRIALSEPLEMWVINVDGSGARLLLVDAFDPHWTP